MRKFQILKSITDVNRDNYPFILKVYIKINDGDLPQMIRFYKIVEKKAKSIEKMVDIYDESFEVLFSVGMIKYLTVFNKVKRSNHGTGCDVFKNIREYREELCSIPTANECFRKNFEHIYNKDFSREYWEFIQISDRFRFIATSTRTQPFWKE